MRLLLDTQILLWWLEGSPKLGPKARAMLAEQHNEAFFSVASPWEMAIKIGLGRLDVDLEPAVAALGRSGFDQLDISPRHLTTLIALEPLHKDPFDRLIVAQAIAESATLMTSDGMMARYPVRTIGCG